MDFAAFQASLGAPKPPDVGAALQALWYDGRGDWEAAHRHVQDQHDPDSAGIHAYLHRKEGDLANAGYWYRRAGRTPVTGMLEEEWAALVKGLLPDSE